MDITLLQKDLDLFHLLSDAEQAVTVKRVLRLAKTILGKDGNYRFYRFFADMLLECGSSIRPYIKALYFGLYADLSNEALYETDSVEYVRDYNEKTVFPPVVYEKMLHIRYIPFGKAYPELQFDVSQQKYRQSPLKYEHFSQEMVESIIAQMGIENDLEKKWGESIDSISYRVWEEMVDNGMEDIRVEPWEDDDYENAIYYANSTEEEKKDADKDSKYDKIQTIIRVLTGEKTYHER